MIKKDFEALAQVVALARAVGGEARTLTNVVEGLIMVLARGNARFDPERFRAACGEGGRG
jgi:hypothetical protein